MDADNNNGWWSLLSMFVTVCMLPCRSVGAEVNYAIRFSDDADAERFIEKLSEEVEKRMTNLGVQGRSLTFKLMRRKVAPDISVSMSRPFLTH